MGDKKEKINPYIQRALDSGFDPDMAVEKMTREHLGFFLSFYKSCKGTSWEIFYKGKHDSVKDLFFK